MPTYLGLSIYIRLYCRSKHDAPMLLFAEIAAYIGCIGCDIYLGLYARPRTRHASWPPSDIEFLTLPTADSTVAHLAGTAADSGLRDGWGGGPALI